MELVLGPGFRIIADILANGLESGFVADDVLAIIALPQSFIKWLPILFFYPSDIGISRHCLELLHHSRHRCTHIKRCFIDLEEGASMCAPSSRVVASSTVWSFWRIGLGGDIFRGIELSDVTFWS